MKLPFLILSNKSKSLSILIIFYIFCNICNISNKIFYNERDMLIKKGIFCYRNIGD
jgi:hypothetical protein